MSNTPETNASRPVQPHLLQYVDPDPVTEEARWLVPEQVVSVYTYQLQGAGVVYPVLSLVRILTDGTYNTCMIPLERLLPLTSMWGCDHLAVTELLSTTPIVNQAEYVRRNSLNGTLAPTNAIDDAMGVIGPGIAKGLRFLGRITQAAHEATTPQAEQKPKGIRRDVGPLRNKRQ